MDDAVRLIKEIRKIVVQTPITQLERAMPNILDRLDAAERVISANQWPSDQDLRQMWHDWMRIRDATEPEKKAFAFAENQDASTFCVQRFGDYVLGVAKGKGIE